MAWLSDWAYRIEITVDDTDVDSNLSDYPHLIYLSAASGPGNDDVSAVFDELGSDANRKKIAVTLSDGTTQCYVEIERWDDANEVAWLWVKVSSILASGGATLYLYYDSAKADNTTYVGDTTDAAAQSVWDDDFEFVCHMAQDPNGDAASSVKDSTSNVLHLTPHGSMTTADLVDSLVGKGIDLDGSDDVLTTANEDTYLDLTSTLTLEAVINPSYQLDSGLSYYKWIYGRMAYPNSGVDSYGILISADGLLFLGSYGGDIQGTKSSWAQDTNFVIAGTYDYNGGSPQGDLFVDGVKETLTNDNYDAMAGGSNSLSIGCHDLSSPDYAWPGIIDEIRISKIVRADAWIKFTNSSLRDDANSFGGEVAYSGNYSVDVSAGLEFVLGLDTPAFTEGIACPDALDFVLGIEGDKPIFVIILTDALGFVLGLDDAEITYIGRDLWSFNSFITKILSEGSVIEKITSKQSRITKIFKENSSLR